VTFGPLASEDGSNPVWNRGLPDPTCTGVYCHGATLGGGTLTEPIWTKVDGTQAYCGSCHSNPPPPPNHPPASPCADCHAYAPETHIDGEVTYDF
jgi:predicted CxxxxCH...CXXCH cytochrome family protein